MPFKTPEAKLAWRRAYAKRSAVIAKKVEWDQTYQAKKQALGIPKDLPLDPLKRANMLLMRDEQAKRAAARRAEAIALAPRKKADRINKDKRCRRKMRRLAIIAMGGECEWCGYDIEDALEFDHIEPLYRKTNGLNKNRDATTSKVYRGIIKGDLRDEFQLLCACCHTIKTRHADIASFYAEPVAEDQMQPVAA